ncbi:mitotic interactor and substrate of PLK1 [Gracilinanus agilis]|uniref:mitotic interactor and substrate of PLK1 n=1 Tax=Gracilinanus agilis TaxID=191870 RepID=UPI001CFF1A56|nr:mitotic interactor and substrate of PLK1 [Gracilinanus agilis]
MDRVTRQPIFSIPRSPKVSGLPSDLENHYTFDIIQVESESPGWDTDIDGVNSDGPSFRFRPEETPGLRMVTVTREIVSVPLVQETKHVLTKNSRTEPWTPPQEREAQLEVLRTGPTYSLRAYPEEHHPGKLYSEEEEEEEQQLYRLGPGENVFLKRKKDLEREREAIIRGQAVRRNTTVATRWSSQEELDKISSGQGQSAASDPENAIDTDQINFLAARQQFMNLEKLSLNDQPAPKSLGRATRASPEAGRAGVGQSTRYSGSGKAGLTNGYTVSFKAQGKDNAEGAGAGLGNSGPASLSRSMVQLSSPPVEDASALGSGEGLPELVPPHEEPKETPIEKEIRRAQEREADLRQQRGLQRSGSRDELVEIPARLVLSKVNLILTPTPKKGKDKGRPSSLYIQREIALDTKREEDHRRQAALPKPISATNRASGPSHLAKGSAPPKGAPTMRRTQSSDSILSLTSDTHPVEATLEGKKISRIPLDAYQPYLTPNSTKMEFSNSSSKVDSSLDYGRPTKGSREEKGVDVFPSSSQRAAWGGQITEQPRKSQTTTIQRQELQRPSFQESTPKAWETQGREALGTRWEENVASPLPSLQKASWSGEQIREQPRKSQASPTKRQELQRPSFQESTQKAWETQGREALGTRWEENVASPPPSLQKASWGGEQIREQPRKSQASPTKRQEPWGSPSQKSTQKAWDAQERAAGDASQGVIRRDYFYLRPLKIKFTFSPEPNKASVPRQERVWEPKGHVEQVATPPKPSRSQSSSLLEMEIQSVLQRERELEEERRNALFPEVFSPSAEEDQPFEWGTPDSRRSSTASGKGLVPRTALGSIPQA